MLERTPTASTLNGDWSKKSWYTPTMPLEMTVIVIDELSDFKNLPAERVKLKPADEAKLKNLTRMYNLAKVKRDRILMTDLEKQIIALRIK